MKPQSGSNNSSVHDDDDDDDDNVVFFKIAKKTTTTTSSSPVAVVAPIPAKISRAVQATRKPAVKREREEEEDAVFVAPASKHVVVPSEYSGEDVSSPVLGVLGTFDKGHKGRQAEQQRVDLSRQRIRQSHKTIEPLPADGKAVVIDDTDNFGYELTARSMQEAIAATGRAVHAFHLHGVKSQTILCSPDWQFLRSV